MFWIDVVSVIWCISEWNDISDIYIKYCYFKITNIVDLFTILTHSYLIMTFSKEYLKNVGEDLSRSTGNWMGCYLDVG